MYKLVFVLLLTKYAAYLRSSKLCLNMRHCATFLCLTHQARVLLERGGFSRQASAEQLAYDNLRLQYQALQLELEQLKATNPTLAERILACMSDIVTIARSVL